jgi:hypothetical protein
MKPSASSRALSQQFETRMLAADRLRSAVNMVCPTRRCAAKRAAWHEQRLPFQTRYGHPAGLLDDTIRYNREGSARCALGSPGRTGLRRTCKEPSAASGRPKPKCQQARCRIAARPVTNARARCNRYIKNCVSCPRSGRVRFVGPKPAGWSPWCRYRRTAL